ncbi:hypothetical protein LHL03_09140 [Pectobacterium carotovorum]|uniref:hypothetical protein n=1 Tax=Pectobacterium carotovorum TaxID=554 RepID=UPI0010FD6579|nr:hypothetical protein [Pectobacterium carotovorum]KAA3667497.1 hypothetical protein FEV48_10970 [Pectobacterium carotovorum subsp. carotovorum]UCZ81271.1 hypothetical protein LHL03_09140 [Pectobacterium carotovorum]
MANPWRYVDKKSDSVIMTLNNFNVTKITIKLNFVILITKNEVNVTPTIGRMKRWRGLNRIKQKRKRPSFLNLKGGNDGLLNKGNQRKAVALIQTLGQRKSSGF